MTPTEKQPAVMSDTPRTDAFSQRLTDAKVPISKSWPHWYDYAVALERELAYFQKEIPPCIESANRANLQNSEQLSVLSVLRRFQQLCSWYHQSQEELAEKDRKIAALQSQLNLALNALDRGRK